MEPEKIEVDLDAAHAVEVNRPKRSLACLKRLYIKNGGKKINEATEGAALKAEIQALSDKIRAAKEAKLHINNPREWWINVRKLQQLKYDADLFLTDAPPVTMKNAGDLFTEMKLRWVVKTPDGNSKRLQRPVQCRHSLTAPEILSIVTEFTASRYPEIGAPLSIAVRADLLDIALRFPKNSPDTKCVCPDPDVMRTLCLDDVLSLPLEFPGPCMPNSTTVDLDVTFAAPPSNVMTPECYTTADQKTSLPELVDAGVNLCENELKEHPLATLHEAAMAGVSQAIALSVDLESSRYNVLVARSARGNAFATVGVHPTVIPEDIKPDATILELAGILDEDRKNPTGQNLIVAVGEIGLDYEKADAKTHDVQMRWFDEQLTLARKFDLPVILHLRGAEAIEDALKVLRSRADGGAWRGSVNCFNGSFDQMKALIDLGFYITWTGLLCNTARAEVLRDVAAKGPLERYLIGSDAPQLIPFNMAKPYPRFNRPCTLPHVASILASLFKMPVHQIASLTTANARSVFKLPSVAFNGALPAAGISYDANAFVEVPLVTMKAPEKPVVQKKGKKGLRLLNDEQIAALIKPGQKAFVNDGFVYSCPPGICEALQVMRSIKNPALGQSLKDFVQAKTIELVHDPTIKKRRRRAAAEGRDIRRRSAGRAVRRRVDRRARRPHGARRAARGGIVGGRGGIRGRGRGLVVVVAAVNLS